MRQIDRPIPTAESVRELPATIPATLAGTYFGLGREGTYRAIDNGQFPIDVLTIGSRLIVTRAALADALGVNLDAPAWNAPAPAATDPEDRTPASTDTDAA